jgi:hypothetical protein
MHYCTVTVCDFCFLPAIVLFFTFANLLLLNPNPNYVGLASYGQRDRKSGNCETSPLPYSDSDGLVIKLHKTR